MVNAVLYPIDPLDVVGSETQTMFSLALVFGFETGGKNCRRPTAVFFGRLPSVTRLEFGKTGRWNRAAQIVVPMLGKCQECID
jgi:hypothetical protein